MSSAFKCILTQTNSALSLVREIQINRSVNVSLIPKTFTVSRVTGPAKPDEFLQSAWREKRTNFIICEFKQWWLMSEKF